MELLTDLPNHKGYKTGNIIRYINVDNVLKVEVSFFYQELSLVLVDASVCQLRGITLQDYKAAFMEVKNALDR